MKKFSASSVFQTICSIACCRVEFGFCLRIFRSFSSNKCLLSAAWTFGNWGPTRRFVTTGENCHQLWSKQRSSTPLPQYKSEFSPLLGNSCWKSGSGVLLSTDLVILNYFRKYFFLSGQEINLNLHWTWRTQTDWLTDSLNHWNIFYRCKIFFSLISIFLKEMYLSVLEIRHQRKRNFFSQFLQLFFWSPHSTKLLSRYLATRATESRS